MVVMARRRGCVVNDDACVHRHGAELVHDDRVDVHLPQLRQFAYHFRHPQQHLLQRLHIDCCRAPPITQNLGHAGALNQGAGQELVQGRQLHGAVIHQLDHGATGTKRNHRAKRVVGDQTDVDLPPPLLEGHVLNRHAVDACLRLQPGHGLHHLQVSIAHAHRPLNIERHALHIRLVADVRGVDLERHRETELGRDHDGFIDAARQNRPGHGNVKRCQQRLGLHFGEHLAPLGQHAFNQHAGTLYVRLGQVRQGRGGLLQQHLVLIKRGDIAKGPHGRLGRAKAGNRGLVQYGASLAHAGVAHQASQQWLAELLVDLCQSRGDGGALKADLG